MELCGVGWVTSVLSEIHEKMFGVPIRWNYEISRFEATRERRPLPRGWCTTWNADPRLLVKRGYDKVIGLQKSLEDACYSHALYYHPETPYWEIMEKNPQFFLPVKDKWLRMERPFVHPKYRKFHLDYLNTHTVRAFNEMLDFLEFPKEGRPLIVPVKAYRNWECYSNVSLSGKEQMAGQLPKIKELYLSDLNLTKMMENDKTNKI